MTVEWSAFRMIPCNQERRPAQLRFFADYAAYFKPFLASDYGLSASKEEQERALFLQRMGGDVTWEKCADIFQHRMNRERFDAIGYVSAAAADQEHGYRRLSFFCEF
jgi:hypothetical protein